MTAEEFFHNARRKPTVCIPSDCNAINEDACVWGYYIKETNYYNVLKFGDEPKRAYGAKVELLGRFCADGCHAQEIGLGLRGCREKGEIVFYDNEGTLCQTEQVSLKIDIFSRNTGILESEAMLGKSAIIVGCGSVGSLIALELARAAEIFSYPLQVTTNIEVEYADKSDNK